MTVNIRFITLQEVISIHVDQIKRYGGKSGIRDINLLSSAIAMPESSFRNQYLHISLFDKAAAYLFHICQNHPFFDGNKRTALATCLMFLELNNIDTSDPKCKLYDITMAVSKGKITIKDISHQLKKLFG